MADAVALEPAPGIRIEWDAEAIGPYARSESDNGWRLTGEPAGEYEGLRVLTASGSGGGSLLIAALRPVGAPGHDADRVAALLGTPGDSHLPVQEALISLQFAGREVRRLGLELYLPGEDYPLRGAGDVIETGGSPGSARFDFHLDGQPGFARLDLIDLTR